MKLSKMLWWCYRRTTDNSIQVRRYYGRGEIHAARGTKSMADATGPYEATTREQALQVARARIDGEPPAPSYNEDQHDR